uniref:Uncharacterized protein n=1 Tax=Chenopodium quinoa TaxID=63459 RepID=A0A803MWP1_CHEQI
MPTAFFSNSSPHVTQLHFWGCGFDDTVVGLNGSNEREGSVEFGNDDMIDEDKEDGDDDGQDVEEIWCEEEGEGEENGEFSYEEEVEDGMEMEYEDGGVSGGGENVGGSSFVTPKRKVMVDTFLGEEEELEPTAIGMVFGSWDEVDSYFWRYARQEGFGIVRATSGWAKVKSELGNCKFCKHRRNAKWTCECYGVPSRKRKVDPLKEGLAQDDDSVKKKENKEVFMPCGVVC